MLRFGIIKQIQWLEKKTFAVNVEDVNLWADDSYKIAQYDI